MKKLLVGLLLSLAAVPSWGQTFFTIFGPAAGIQKNTGATPFNTTAVATDVYGLFGCSGSSTSFLNGAGGCTTPTGTTTSANPSATLGLTAVNGTATTFMTSDSAPALSQAISPTWTGVHGFNGAYVTSSATSLTSPGQNGITFVNSGAGANAKIWDVLQTTANHLTFRAVNDTFGSAGNWLDVTRSGLPITAITIGNTTDKPAITLNGATTIPAPSSGTALAVTGLSGSPTITAAASSGPAAVSGWGWNNGITTNAWNLYSQSTDPMTVGTAGAATLSLGTNGTARVTINSAGNMVENAPSSGTSLTVNGVANAYTTLVTGSATSGQSFGLRVNAGTTSADAVFNLQTQGAATLLTVAGDGGVTVGTPTGGDEGLGTINAASGYFLNGVNQRILSINGNCSTGTCTSSNADGMSSTITRTSTGVYNVAYSVTFARSNCVVSLAPASGAILIPIASGTSGTGVQIQMFTTSNVAADGNFSLMCKGTP